MQLPRTIRFFLGLALAFLTAGARGQSTIHKEAKTPLTLFDKYPYVVPLQLTSHPA